MNPVTQLGPEGRPLRRLPNMDFASFQKKRREVDDARARRLQRLLRIQSALGIAVALPLSIWLYGLFFLGTWNTSAVQVLLLFLLPFMVVSHRRHVGAARGAGAHHHRHLRDPLLRPTQPSPRFSCGHPGAERVGIRRRGRTEDMVAWL